jgi:hypothetical protein
MGTAALGLTLVLVILLVATGESLRQPDRSYPFTEGLEPELPLHAVPADDVERHPGAAAWMTR